MRPGTSRCGDSSRAQSEVVGVVLVLGMVLAGATTVVVFGASAFADSQEGLATQRAEKAMTQFDSKAALVALGNTDVQRVSFAQRGGEQYGVTNGTGWMNVSVQNTTDGTWENVTQRMGSVTYDNGDDHIAYQGGGVWRSTGPGSVMVSPPEFHYRNGTLTLPIVNVTGDRSLDGGAGVTHVDTRSEFPDRNVASRQNPMDEHRIWVQVQSDYYEAWGRYFSDRTDGVVEYDHDDRTVTLELVSPFGRRTVENAIAGLGSGGTFTLHGSAANTCHGGNVVDSYDSSAGDYCSQSVAEDGDIVYAGDVDISTGTGSDDIRGNLVAGGDVEVGNGNGQPAVHGHLNYTDTCLDSVSACQNVVTGGHTVNHISGVETTSSIDYHVQNIHEEVAGDNDNTAEQNVTGAEVQYDAAGPSDQATLGAGRYFLEQIDFSGGDTLTLDSTDGDVTVVVEEAVDIGSNSIEIEGENAAKIYVVGDHGGTWDVEIGSGAVTAPDDNATRLRLYGQANFQMRMDGSGGSNEAKFVGVVYAPPGAAGTSAIEMNHAELFGGVILGDTDIGNNGGGGSIHYDEALSGRQIITQSAHVVKVTYLHVTVNSVSVSDQ